MRKLLALLLFALPIACRSAAESPVDLAREQARFLDELEAAGLGADAAPTGLELEADELIPSGAARMAATLPRLYTIDLPAGDVGSLNVGWFRNGATILDPKTWLAQGYQGVKFRGQGIDVTHLRCTSWDGITVAVGRHAGIVRLENLTLHAGYDRGTAFGEQNLGRQVVPEFRVELADVRAVVDPPWDYWTRYGRFIVEAAGKGYRVGDSLTVLGADVAPTFRVTAANPIGVVETPTDQVDGAIRSLELVAAGRFARPPPFVGQGTSSSGQGTGALIALGQRPKWLLFGYQSDLVLRRVTLNAREAVEHASYWHGFAKFGALVESCTFEASGAEGFKVRSDATETGWAGPGVRVIIRDSTFREWRQPWSWRGGAAIVLQGSAAHVLVERCAFFGGAAISGATASERCHAVMVSSEGASYDQATGAIGTGFGTGFVVVRQCVAVGSSEFDWRNEIIRCGRNGGAQASARGFLLEEVGAWGPKVIVSLSDIPAGWAAVRNCNGPAQKAYAESIGMLTTPEATIPTSSRRVPISEGWSR